MRDYSKVFKEFWIGETGRYIRSCGHEVRTLATYLITCPHANVLGLYYLPLPLLCHEAGLTEEGALKGLRRLSEVGFARYDPPSETVWVVNMARFQLGETLDPKDNNAKWLPTALESLPKGPFLQEFYEYYREAYHLPPPKGLGRGLEGASEPHRSIEILDLRSLDSDSDGGGVVGREMSGALSGAREETPHRRHRIPEGWQPGEEEKAWAREKGYDRLIDLEVETQEFYEFWHHVKDAKQASKLNWGVEWKRRMTEQYHRARKQERATSPTKPKVAKGLSPEALAEIQLIQRKKAEEERRVQQRSAGVRQGDGDHGRLSAGA